MTEKDLPGTIRDHYKGKPPMLPATPILKIGVRDTDKSGEVWTITTKRYRDTWKLKGQPGQRPWTKTKSVII